MKTLRPLALILSIALSIALLASAAAQDAETMRRMNRGVGLMEQYRFAEAAEAFQKAAEAAPEWSYAWLNLGIAQLNAASDPNATDALDQAQKAFLKAEALNRSLPHPQYCIGVLARYRGDNEEAARRFRATLQRDPNSADSLYFLGAIQLARGEYEAARRRLEDALRINPYLLSARYSLGQALVRLNRREEALAQMERFREMDAAGAGVKRSISYGEMGVYADIVRVYPAASFEEPSAPPIEVSFAFGKIDLPAPHSETAFALTDLRRDGRLDLYLPNAGVLCAADPEYGFAETIPIPAEGFAGAVFGDMDDDGDDDLFVFGSAGGRLLRNEGGGRFADATEQSGVRLLGPVRAAAWVDADHEGDLDLIAASADRLALFRNNGGGAFQELRAAEGGSAGPPWEADAYFALGDFDGDIDVDLAAFPVDGAPRLFRNDRLNRWTDISAESGLAELPAGGLPTAADLNGDGAVDLLILSGARAEIALNRGGRFQRNVLFQADAPAAADAAVTLDADNDGDIDIAVRFSDAERSRTLLFENDGSGAFRDASDRFGFSAVERLRGPLAAADIDGDGDTDLIALDGGGAVVQFRNDGGNANNWLHAALEGERANRSGYGAQIEARAGGMRAAAESHMIGSLVAASNPRVEFGLGNRRGADYLRVVWTNGVLQSELEVAANQLLRVKEAQRKASSCPILFAWNGERYEFISDFMGVGGLGFFAAPGVYAQPDPTERLKIEPGQLAPVDGEYRLQILEPLEEVCYIDRIALIAVDHPIGTEVYPDERMAADGNLPTEAVYAFSKRYYPQRALDGEGRDLLPALLQRDRRYPPLKLHKRYIGFLENETSIELDFSSAAAEMDPDERWALFIYGWVEYPYSHVMYAASQEGLALEGVSVDVRRNGEWESAAPNAGYPAGMPKMMTLELPNRDPEEWSAVRLRMNQEIYIDEIFLADVSEPPAAAHTAFASRAELRRAGYPREYSPDGRLPRLYDYDSLDSTFPFKNMRGAHTRFGDVRPLLAETDDLFVVMGRGDGLETAFRAGDFPPVPEGMTRSFILDTFGYCKDMDLYTAYPETVNPLPYRAMPSFPYPPGSAYPDTAAVRAYLLKYQTRMK